MKTISPAKANSLYWLGRYTERVYGALHMLQKYYDLTIDGDMGAYAEFCRRIGYSSCDKDPDEFIVDYLYNREAVGSVFWTLDRVNDNAILLREDIKSETLSYVHLALRAMQDYSLAMKTNIGELQPVIDDMLAFWGSVSERVYNEKTLALLRTGKHTEYIELRIRFGYEKERILEAWYRLRTHIERLMPSAVDSLERCGLLLMADLKEASVKKAALTALNGLVQV